VKLFVAKGANLDGLNKVGNTALMIASEQCHEGIVHYLAHQGANVNIKNQWDNNAWYYANRSLNSNPN
jgi:ankyrin repeat protein